MDGGFVLRLITSVLTNGFFFAHGLVCHRAHQAGPVPSSLAPPQQPPPQPQPQPQAPVPAAQQPNKITALFANAAQRSSPQVPVMVVEAPTPTAAAAAAADPAATRAKLRTAFNRLLAQDVFVDMLAAEFRAAGLLN